MIHEYEHALIFHFSLQTEDRGEHFKLMARLSELERTLFLDGYYRVFLLQYGSCILCKDCVAEGTRVKCINKMRSRPGADAMGIDIYQTAHNVGYPVKVLKNHDETTNRFAFILIE
jgi:predicted metal-binding protein